MFSVLLKDTLEANHRLNHLQVTHDVSMLPRDLRDPQMHCHCDAGICDLKKKAFAMKLVSDTRSNYYFSIIFPDNLFPISFSQQ